MESVSGLINAMDKNDIINMQMANRKLWVEKLSFSGFYYSFTKKILKKTIKNNGSDS